MFTGIIQAVGSIQSMAPLHATDGDQRLIVDAQGLPLRDVDIGDSICVRGVCLTVVERSDASFAADVSKETLTVTAGFAIGQEVNLEKSLTLASKLGGHIVTGHVDGVGTVTQLNDLGASWFLEVRAPHAIKHYIARKGSIAIDGISLTVNSVSDDLFTVNIIPHTFAVTTVRNLDVGAKVNLEVDPIARYVERMLSTVEARSL